MKFLIHLPTKSAYANAKVGKPPLVFERSAQFGGRHVLYGREITAEELNAVADKLFRPKFAPSPKNRPSITALIDGQLPDLPTDTSEETGPETNDNPELTLEEQENWILSKAEEILQRRATPPVTPVAEAAPPEPAPVKNKGGRPPKPKAE